MIYSNFEFILQPYAIFLLFLLKYIKYHELEVHFNKYVS